MDFGSGCFDSLLTPETGPSPVVSAVENGERVPGSGYPEEPRSFTADEAWRSIKAARADTMPNHQRGSYSRTGSRSVFKDQDQLLSFSSLANRASSVSDHQFSESSSRGGMRVYQGPVYQGPASNGVDYISQKNYLLGFRREPRRPFSPSQWIEFEHHLLIFKFLCANVPVPSFLLIPIRKFLVAPGLSSFHPGSSRPSTLAWGSASTGLSGRADLEPGRCRRTDGKKWRCSRDAVADQKYCERHINRGRHRSRKHVEGHTGSATSMPAAAVPWSQPVSSSASVVASVSGTSDRLAAAPSVHIKGRLIGSSSGAAAHMGRFARNKSVVVDHGEGSQGQPSVLPNELPHNESSCVEFELPNFDFLLNPMKSSYMHEEHHKNSEREADLDPFGHFTRNWPINQSDCGPLNLFEMGKIESDSTKLTISIPSTSAELSSQLEDQTLLSLNSLIKSDFVPLGLGASSHFNETTQNQANYAPITSWQSSLCGPLGEALKNASRSPGEVRSSSSQIPEEWNANPCLESSPSGVLQLPSFGCHSNSSSGSSPRVKSRTCDSNGEVGNELMSTFPNAAALSL